MVKEGESATRDFINLYKHSKVYVTKGKVRYHFVSSTVKMQGIGEFVLKGDTLFFTNNGIIFGGEYAIALSDIKVPASKLLFGYFFDNYVPKSLTVIKEIMKNNRKTFLITLHDRRYSLRFKKNRLEQIRHGKDYAAFTYRRGMLYSITANAGNRYLEAIFDFH